MILQRGQERDDAVRRKPRAFGQAMRRVNVLGIGELIQPPREPDVEDRDRLPQIASEYF